MWTDDECLAQLLDEHYGLLDPEESRALHEYLANHPRKADLSARAAEQVRLVTAASRQSFPEVTFADPPLAAAAPNGPPQGEVTVAPVVPDAPRKSMTFVWVRWAVAAAILLTGGTLLAPVGKHLVGSFDANRQVAEAKRKLDGLDELRRQNVQEFVGRRNDLKQQIGTAQTRAGELRTQMQARRQAVEAEPLDLVVTGPAALQPGAPNEYQIDTKDARNQPAPARLAVRVFDKNDPDKAVFTAGDLASQGAVPVALPLDLPLTPGSELYLEVVATGAAGQRTELREKLLLAGPVYATHLATDKPLYQPGETVYFRSLTIDRASLRPPTEPLRLHYTLLGPLGQIIGAPLHGTDQLVAGGSLQPVIGPDGKPVRGVGCGAFALPGDAAGGEYTLKVEEANRRFPPETRKFNVAQYRQPVYEKELEYARRSYGPGDEVVAYLRVRQAGRPAAGLRVQPRVDVDGQQIPNLAGVQTDANGGAAVKFRLPDRIENGAVTLTLTVRGGATDTLVRPVPVVLKKLLVEFYPEGGELIAGVPQRVYFQARNSLDKPADVRRARLVDGGGKVVRVVNAAGQDTTLIETFADDKEPGLNQGQGAFTFTPQAGQTYELKVDEPAGVTVEARWPGDAPNQIQPRPTVRPDGIALRVLDGVSADKQPVRVALHNAGPARKLLVGAYCRGRVIDQKWVEVGANRPAEVALNSDSGHGGVLRLTVFEQAGNDLRPRAERLIYRRPAGKLQFTLSPDKAQYAPGETVRLTVAAADEAGRPVPAVVMVAVVNNGTVVMADEKTARGLPTQILVTSEVRKPDDLEYADVLLSDHPKAPAALDLLLGTQGWRRFIEQLGPQAAPPDSDPARLVVMTGQAAKQVVSRKKELLEAIDRDLGPELRASQDAETKAEAELERVNASLAAVRAQDVGFRNQVAQAQVEYAQARGVADRYEAQRRAGSGAALALVILAALAGALISLAGLLAGRRSWRWVTGLAGSAGLLIVAGTTCVVWVSFALNSRGEAAAADRTTGAAPSARGADLALPPAGGAALPEAAAPAMMEPRVAPNIAPVPQPAMPAGPVGMRLAPPGPPPLVIQNQKPASPPQQPIRRRPAGPAADQKVVPPAGQGQQPAAPAAPLTVREYAHARTAAAVTREDFTETVLWKPALVLPESGQAVLEFQLADAVTPYRVVVAGHTLDGRLGESAGKFTAVKPFSLDAKLPVELTAGDTLDLPVTLTNETDANRTARLTVRAQNATLAGPAELAGLELGPRQTDRRLFRLKPATVEGRIDLRLEGASEPFAPDAVALSVPVVPAGFPVVGAKSDVLERVAVHTVALPPAWVPGTLKLRVDAFPSTMAELQKGLDGLMREPGGCFEQTSSSNYPNVMILDYLRESDQANPEVLKRSRELMDRGYRQLTRFECQKPGGAEREGYEWFGGAVPPHEALTAYGLLQFRDMARVHDVDQQMVDRTRTYLLARRDGKGGFLRNAKALDGFGRAPENLTNAYIVWALTETDPDGKDDLSKELAAMTAEAQASKDPYFLALVANSLLNRGPRDAGVAILERVAAMQAADGFVDGAKTSITSSGGRDLKIETTALAVLGWLKANRPEKFARPLQSAVKWVGQQRGGYGGFGATQSTILALKALSAWTKANKQAAESGTLTVSVGGRVIGTKAFAAGSADTITVEAPDAERVLKAGANEVRVEVSGKNTYPYTLSWSYHTEQPLSAEGCPVRLTTRLDRAKAAEGESVRLTAVVDNQAGQAQGMTVAVIGLPAGLKLPEDQKELKQLALPRSNGAEPGEISAYEIRGRELVLYWRALPPGKREVGVTLVCHVPGEFRGPASRAYLYYNADVKHWTEPLAVTITPGAGK